MNDINYSYFINKLDSGYVLLLRFGVEDEHPLVREAALGALAALLGGSDHERVLRTAYPWTDGLRRPATASRKYYEVRIGVKNYIISTTIILQFQMPSQSFALVIHPIPGNR